MDYPKLNKSSQGFTLLELIIISTIVGVLAAIAAPNWLGFFNRQQLNTANNQVYQAMRQAQSRAMQERETWQASFREQNNVVQWAVHRASLASGEIAWNSFPNSIKLDRESNLPKVQGIFRVRFNYKGCPVYNPNDTCTNTTIRTKGRLTLSSLNGSDAKRCVIVSTLIGALRTSQEQATPDENNRFCY
ncbi:MAG: prepilin-type N-terminal cleavage/methylation domain-containing protein [Hydrococcus sp. Prado102]|jgi:prepilin-type N-terminal cleavage/methylation domain-containing protein|nr:prepilin-type N-terminal cleavage/methylation domain-containing protein [Hydrococcus sp. Prado102]